MKAILFGATGMVGQGVLRECLLDKDVEEVVTVGRSATGQRHAKLREIVQPNLHDLSAVQDSLTGYQACFFCLGIASAGLSEDDYRRITYDIAVNAAAMLAKRNPAMTFIFVSGQGTDANSRVMWSRVKGQTENAILAMPFRASYAFRPGFIRALDGIRSKTKVYRILYSLLWPLMPLATLLAPDHVTTTRMIGRAMLNVVRRGHPVPVLSTRDINAAAA